MKTEAANEFFNKFVDKVKAAYVANRVKSLIILLNL
jgi:hypothetical protein